MLYKKILYLAKKSKMKKPITVGISISICLSSVIGAFIAPVTVYAMSATGLQSTIASIILSLLLSSGTAPVNSTWVNTLNSAYGAQSTIGTIADCIESGLLTETATGLVDSGLSAAIEALPEYSTLQLESIFSTAAADGVAVATGGTNLATTAIELGTAGTIATFAGAAITGVGAGVLINHVRETFSNYIKYGFPMSANDINNIVNNVPAGYDQGFFDLRRVSGYDFGRYYFVPNNIYCIGYVGSSGAIASNFYDSNGNTYPYHYFRSYRNSTLDADELQNNSTGPSWGQRTTVTIDHSDISVFNSSAERAAYIDSIKSGQEQFPDRTYPDIVTPSGNAFIGGDGTDNINGAQPIVPNGYTINPVDMDDYLNFVDDANQNTDDGNVDEDTQGQLFNDLVNPLLSPIQEPDQPVDPSNPDHPANPDQPTIPDKPAVNDAQIEESLNLTATAELKEVFPFCIPFDIVDCLLLFRVANRHAPYIQFTFIDGNEITLDFSIFDSVAELLRMLELIAFIVGLAISTRYLIGAT